MEERELYTIRIIFHVYIDILYKYIYNQTTKLYYICLIFLHKKTFPYIQQNIYKK